MKKPISKKAGNVRKNESDAEQAAEHKLKQRGDRKKTVPGKSKSRMDWEVNDQLICDKFFELMMLKKKMPTYVEIAEAIGCNEKTVERHVNDISFEDRFKKFRLASDKVIINLLKNAAIGKNDKMIRLWLERFEGLGEKKLIDITTQGKSIRPMVVITQDEATKKAIETL